MRVTSLSELRRTLTTTLDRLAEDHAPMRIVRDKGKPAAVLISLEDYEAHGETWHLLCNPRNAARLLDAIEGLERGEGTPRALSE